jgi:hypothetical protein
MAEIFNGLVYPTNAAMESRDAEDLKKIPRLGARPAGSHSRGRAYLLDDDVLQTVNLAIRGQLRKDIRTVSSPQGSSI